MPAIIVLWRKIKQNKMERACEGMLLLSMVVREDCSDEWYLRSYVEEG